MAKKDIDILHKEMHKEIALVGRDMKIMEIRITGIIAIVMILLNQNSLTFLARLLGLMK